MKAIVVAYDQQHAIGVGSELPWGRDLPADMAHFRSITTGGTVIMGRKTYQAIGRALPGRQNIVVSRSDFAADNVLAVHSLAEAYEKAEKPIFVIGGGEIYAVSLPTIDIVYATEVQATFAGATAFFPLLDGSWQEVERQSFQADAENKYAYDFVTYRRN